MRAYASSKCRHLVLRGAEGELLPRALVRALDEGSVACGWLRGAGVLADVELRVFGERLASHGRARRFDGPLQALVLEGSVGLLAHKPSVGLRAVLVHETDRGVETVAGEIVTARVIALEAFVTALDDVRLARELDEPSGMFLLAPPEAPLASSEEPFGAGGPKPGGGAPTASPVGRRAEPSGEWGHAIAASAEAEEDDAELESHEEPRAGDFVEHFAFGRCEVLRADGGRLRIKVPKDGRIREISIDVLRVVPIEGRGGPRRSFRLERKG